MPAKRILLAGVLIALVIIAGCMSAPRQKGVLAGHVTIGPLCPVEPCNVTPDQLAQAYATRKIFVYTEDHATLVKEISINSTGYYRAELDPGNYVVDILHTGVGGSKDLPRDAAIEPGKTITLDIDIDTGIR